MNKESIIHLCYTIAAERYSFYVIQTLIVLYFITELHLSKTVAFSLFGAYVALTYILPIVTGPLSNKLLNYDRAIWYGCCYIFLANLLLGLGSTYLALALLTVGTAFIKTNIATLYANFKDHKTNVYKLYYLFVNIGAMLALLVSGLVARYFGYHITFLMSAVLSGK